MTAFDGADLGERLRHSEHPDPLYAALLDGASDDWAAGGVMREILAGHEDDAAADMIHLRFLASLFRVVLTGDAPELEPFYPCLGGTAAPEGVWAVAEPVLRRWAPRVREGLAAHPQTNDPGRSIALLVGLSYAVRAHGLSRVRLLEPGASAGLNLLLDRFRFVGDGWSWGPVGSPLVMDGLGLAGFAPPAVEVVSRRGCDLLPIDAASEEGAVLLRSFVWPSQVGRHERLSAALEVARVEPVIVDRAGAADWLEAQLGGAAGPDGARGEVVEPGVLTVVWQSITRQYWPAEETRRVDALVAEARSRGPVAHVAMEDPRAVGLDPGDGLPVTIEVDGELVARCHYHGVPVELT
ncbi:hypothetical protein BCF74_10715 [Knoellia remsis]|uniref:DUF2332 domain-containing protein n=1 Tax=Knoellia remsis TaxID=407159 RepID=A0A2T0UQM0_9MICO|nr:DUF2332 domain-containing protein [Knoellia remsis]PRY60229.1 hypothetical protein BCF74_10715 [Knoellia remsis]